jgi:hypothetical protein
VLLGRALMDGCIGAASTGELWVKHRD